MGVPRFYTWITRRYKMIKQNMMEHDRPTFNTLFFDATTLAAQAIENTHHTENIPSEDFLNEAFRLIDTIVHVIEPTNLIFISFDGIPTFAKIHTLRQRYFKTALEELPAGSFNWSNFNRSAKFMKIFTEKILERIAEQTKVDPQWSKPKVIFSSTQVPGEAETKLMDYYRYIRSQPDYDKESTHCIFTPDSDLIFMSLQAHDPNIALLRPSYFATNGIGDLNNRIFYTAHDFDLLYISLLRDYIRQENQQEDFERFIDDYVALSFIFGNDFIPSFPDVQISGFQEIIDCYNKVVHGQYLIEGEYFNKHVLKLVFTEMTEDAISKSRLSKEEYINKYKLQFPTDERLALMCKEVIKVLDFILLLYRGKCKSWRYYYPYQICPPMCLILPFIEDSKPEPITYEPPFNNLYHDFVTATKLTVDIIAKPLAKLLVPPSKTAYMFPPNPPYISKDSTFIDLPDLDMRLLEKEYNEHINECDEEVIKLSKSMRNIELKNGELIEFDTEESPTFSPSNVSPQNQQFPTFSTIQIESNINKTNSYSHWIEIKPKITPEQTIQSAEKLLNKEIYYDWPYTSRGLVIGAHLNKDKLEIKNKLPVYSKDEANQSDFVQKKVIEQFSSNGISDPGSDIILVVIDQNGIYRFCYYSLALMATPLPKPDLIIPKNDDLVILDNGQSGVVKGYDEKNNTFKIMIKLNNVPNLVVIKNDESTWVTDETITKAIKLEFRLLRMITTRVMYQNENIAYQLFISNLKESARSNQKHTANDYAYDCLIGYTRITNGQKYFSKSLIPTLNSYTNKIGPVIEQLRKSGKIFNEKDIRNGEEIFEWLKQNSMFGRTVFVPEQFACLSNETIFMLENALKNHNALTKDQMPVINVSALNVIWKGKNHMNYFRQKPIFGQRIRSIINTSLIPFGAIGTVIGFDCCRNLLIVVFDQEFQYATRLFGLLKTKRGLIMNTKDVIPIVTNK